jgi:hypothetical protein
MPLSDAGNPYAAIADASWFPDDLGPDGTVSFVKVVRDELSQQAFLDERWQREQLPRRRHRLEEIAQQLPVRLSRPRLNFIWHTAFCCSTAISRALDCPGRNLSLREPEILTTLASAKRSAGTGFDDAAPAVFSLLARPFFSGAAVTVKPTNSANNLIQDAARLTSGKMLFLFSDLPSFILAIAKRGERGRAFARRLFWAIARDGHPQFGWPMEKLFSLSDLEIAALAWHMQVETLLRAWPLLDPARVASLDCDAFLDSPAETLAALDRFFGLGLAETHLTSVGRESGAHAKHADRTFSAAVRRDENQKSREQIGIVLDEIVDWSYEVCPSTPRGVPFPAPLVAIGKTYSR